MIEERPRRRSYAVSEAVGSPVEAAPRARIGGLRRRADHMRGLATCFLFFALAAALVGGAAAFRGEGSVLIPSLLALAVGDIGLGLLRRRKGARIAAAVALHASFAAGLLALPEGGLLSGTFLASRRLAVGLGGMAFSAAALWALLSRPSERLFEDGPCAVSDAARGSRSAFFWAGLFALTVFLRVMPWIVASTN